MSQSIGQLPADESTEGIRPRRRRSRGTWLAIAGAVVCLAFTSLASWKYLTRPRSRLGGAAVGARKMPDGTVLVLEHVTTKQPHEMAVPVPTQSLVASWIHGRSPASERRIGVHPANSAVVVWFTRWHPGLANSLDFDWWTASVLTDAHGEEISDVNEQSHVISAAGGVSSRGAARPWPSLAVAKGDIIVATSQLPRLRQVAGRRRVRVYGRSGSMVAEFEVPFPDTSAVPHWTPEMLPAVKSAEDVRVTFTKVAVQPRDPPELVGIKLKHRRPHWSVVPEFEVERNGVLAPEWKAEAIRLTDALGNGGWGWDCGLSTYERAWKLELTLSRDSPQAFAADEQWESPLVALPGADSLQPLEHDGTVQSVEVSLTAIGSGAVRHAGFASTRSQETRHSSGARAVGGKTYGLSHSSTSRSGGPTVHSADITGDCTHLLVKLDRLPLNHREMFRIHDDQGRELLHAMETFTFGDQVYAFVFVAPASDTQALRLTTYVHTARTVELLIPPPTREQRSEE